MASYEKSEKSYFSYFSGGRGYKIDATIFSIFFFERVRFARDLGVPRVPGAHSRIFFLLFFNDTCLCKRVLLR